MPGNGLVHGAPMGSTLGRTLFAKVKADLAAIASPGGGFDRLAWFPDN